MFTNISMAGAGWVGLILTTVLNYFGFEASKENIEGLAVALLAFLSVLAAFWGQVRRSDLTWGFFRK